MCPDQEDSRNRDAHMESGLFSSSRSCDQDEGRHDGEAGQELEQTDVDVVGVTSFKSRMRRLLQLSLLFLRLKW